MARVRPLLIIVIPLLLGLLAGAAGYTVYVRGRERYFTDRYLRAVGTLASQLHMNVQILREAIVHATSDTPLGQTPAHTLKQISQLEYVENPSKDDACTIGPYEAPGVSVVFRPVRFEGFFTTQTAAEAAWDPREGVSLYFRHRADGVDYCLRTQLGPMMEEKLKANTLLGTDVFVVDTSSGRVLYFGGTSPLRVTSFPTTAPALAPSATPIPGTKSDDLPTTEALSRASLATDVTIFGLQYKLFSQPVRMPCLRNLGNATSPPCSEYGASQWAVGVFVPMRAFNRDTWAISSLFTAVVPILLMIAVLSFPIVKLGVLGSRDRVSARDLHSAAVCLVLLAAVYTVVWTAIAHYTAVERALDSQLKSTSSQLRYRLAHDVRRLHALMRAYWEVHEDQCRGSGPNIVRVRRSCEESVDECLDVIRQYFTCRREQWCRRFASALHDAASDHRVVELLSLVDAGHQQFEKWTLGDETTPFISLDGYGSVEDADTKRAFRSTGRAALTLNALNSPNTGNFISVASLPVGAPDADKERVGLSVIAVPYLPSISDPWIANGNEFAIVDRAGTVVYHSNPNRQLSEHMFSEAENAPRLRSAVLGRKPALFAMEYHGRPVRAYVHPLARTTWSVVVFRDQELLRTAVVDAVACATGHFFLLVILYLMVGVWLMFSRHDRGSEWLWPDHRSSEVYRRCVVLASGLVAWCIVGLTSFGETAALLVTLLAATCGTTGLYLLLTGRRSGSLHFHWQHRSWTWRQGLVMAVCASAFALLVWVSTQDGARHLSPVMIVGLCALYVVVAWGLLRWLQWRVRTLWRLAGLLAFSLAGVWPAVALYRDASDLVIENATRLRQLEAVDAFAERAQRLEASFPSTPDGVITELIRDWRSAQDEGCKPPGAGSTADPLGERLASFQSDPMNPIRHLTGWGMAWMPLYNPESVRMQRAMADQSPDGSWKRKANPGCSSIVVRDDRLTRLARAKDWPKDWPNDELPLLSRGVPRLGASIGTDRVNWLGIVLAMLLGSAGLLAVGRLADRIFGGRSLGDDPGNGGAPEYRTKGAIYLRADPVTRNRLLSGPSDPIDMRTVGQPNVLRVTAGLQGPNVVLSNFEHRFGDPEWDVFKLELLEALVFGGRFSSIVVLSDVDLLAAVERSLDAADTPQVTAYRRRWAMVCAALVKHHSPAGPADRGMTLTDRHEIEHDERAWLRQVPALDERIRDVLHGRQLSRVDALSYIVEVGDAHFRMLWSQCSDAERLVMIQLAEEEFVGARQWPIVDRLIRMRLVKRRPALRLMSESFRQFVLNAEPAERVEQWESSGGASAWVKARLVMIVIVTAVAAFVLATQPDALTKSLAFLPALAGGASALGRLLGLVQEPPARPVATP